MDFNQKKLSYIFSVDDYNKPMQATEYDEMIKNVTHFELYPGVREGWRVFSWKKVVFKRVGEWLLSGSSVERVVAEWLNTPDFGI